MTKKKENKFLELYEATFKSNIAEEVATKNKFDYLSWAYATKHLKIHYPDAKVQVVKYPDNNGNVVLPYLGTALGYFVTVRLYLSKEDLKDNIFEEFTHPVFDYRNQPMKSPTSMNINNSIQRATAKVIAIATGIGLSLYANEDIPNEDNAPADNPSYMAKGIKVNMPQPSQKVKSGEPPADAVLEGATDYINKATSLNQLETRIAGTYKKYPDLKENAKLKKVIGDKRLLLEAEQAGL
jgi:hypothetical protein